MLESYVYGMRTLVSQSIYRLGYGLDDRDSIPGRGWFFLLTAAARLALGPTQPIPRDKAAGV